MIYITQVLRRDSESFIKSLSFQKKQISSFSFKFLYHNLKILNKIVLVYLNMEILSLAQD